MINNYNDIINLSRPVSKRPKMSLEQRSAQFAPFAALTGYDGQGKETARLTNRKIEIDEEQKLELNFKIQPQIEITYFVPDERKEGGKYETIKNSIKKIDEYKNKLIMIDGLSISINEIIDIQVL